MSAKHMLVNAEYHAACQRAVRNGDVRATLYRHGAKVLGWPSRWPYKGQERPKRGKVTNQTRRSLIRAAWNISNSDSDFSMFSTLTFREKHANPKACLREFITRTLGLVSQAHPYAWVQEYQRRGVVHYHVLWCLADYQQVYRTEDPEWGTTFRGHSAVQVLRGDLGTYLAREWIRIVGDNSEEFWRFQHGGVHERVANPELAGRYLGGYAGKEGQKRLPDGEAPAGRWWYLSEAAQPVPRGTIEVHAWKAPSPHHLVYDLAKMTGEQALVQTA